MTRNAIRNRIAPLAAAAVTALLCASVQAQSIGVDAKGNLKIDGGDGSRLSTNANGSATVATTPGARVQVGKGRTSVQNIASNDGTRVVEGNNVQRATVRGNRVNIASGGGVAEQTVNGRTQVATSTRTTTSTASRVRGVPAQSYVNGEFDGIALANRNLTGVDFTNASLRKASFGKSILVGADFTNADLRGADLRGANLRNASVVNVDWDGVQLGGATWVDGRVCAAGSVGRCR